jgi:hypothetical protein
LPVGSSANITLGRETSARATATRCCWPLLEPGGVRLATRQLQRQRDVLGRRQHGQQVEELEDEADVVAPQLRELAVVQAADVDAGDGDLARRGLVEAGEDVHQRRLARARRAHDGGQPAFGDLDRHAAQRGDHRVALAVVPDDVTRRDDGLAAWRFRSLGLDDDALHGEPFRGVD